MVKTDPVESPCNVLAGLRFFRLSFNTRCLKSFIEAENRFEKSPINCLTGKAVQTKNAKTARRIGVTLKGFT